jgi:multidrug efflux pump subunit AcrA (membrane-fusion protein)
MPKGKPQERVIPRKTSGIFSDVEKFLSTVVFREELVEAMRKLLTTMKGIEDRFAQNMAQNKDESETTISDLRNEIQDAIARAQEAIDSVQNQSNESLEKAVQQLREEVNAVQTMIPPETDLSDLYQKLQAHESKMDEMSTLQRAENVRNALEVLEDEERLKATAIDGLSELMEDYKETKQKVGKIQGAALTPSPVHWPRHEAFTMNGVDTSVSLTQAPAAAGTAIFGVRYQGQTLDLGDQYTVDGNKITFSFTPINGTTISVSYFG